MNRANFRWYALVCLGYGIFFLPAAWGAGPSDGELPAGSDGRPLNLNFETGDLRDWKATGEAFEGQPIRGDTVRARRSDMESGHEGTYWVGTYEPRGDGPRGTLLSAPFRITKRWASFLVGGGSSSGTRVELVLQDTGEVIFTAHGRNHEKMDRVVVDLQRYQGRLLTVRVVDDESGPWGHVNFDDFRLHDQPPRRAPSQPMPFRYQGLAAAEALRVMEVPEGFRVTLFAAEPDVRQPIAMTIDERGRLWVAEAYTYPVRAPEGQGRDRILIFEDSNGDGKFDRRKVFAEGLNLVSGLEVGFGGVWVGAAPYLLFIPDRDRDDLPDGPAQILLDGWGYQDTHETLNAFLWGPDGWLYGCHGVFTHSRVGRPGCPDSERVPLNAAVWRYHPVKHIFEVFAHGTSNPWGIDFDDFGQAFITACVIPHLYHIIQGGLYQRQAGQHFNLYAYDDLKTIADHLHYAGNIAEHAHWGHEPITPAETVAAGGGHAHCGAMLYLGGSWPASYRGRIFMNNIHGARINMDILERRGSGFVGRHGPDFLVTHDYWSQIVALRYGPDGQVYLLDWYDRNQCHRVDPNVHDRSNGRIYKVSYVGPSPAKLDDVPVWFGSLARAWQQGTLDLARLSDEQLAELQLHPNDWYVRTARRLLQERAAAGRLQQPAVAKLLQLAQGHRDPTRRLRALWALHVTGQLSPPWARSFLSDPDEYVRAWVVQLLAEEPSALNDLMPAWARMAQRDPSPVVRLYLASALQRLSPAQRWPLLDPLLTHPEDATDPNLPLMYWYALEPLIPVDPARALKVAGRGYIPLLWEFTAQRIGELDRTEALAKLLEELLSTDDLARQRAMLRGLQAAFRGRRRVAMPPNWPAVRSKLLQHSEVDVRDLTQSLGVTFGDAESLRLFRQRLANQNLPLPQRQEALRILVDAGDPELPSLLESLLKEPSLRRDAIRALGTYQLPFVAARLLELYPNLERGEQREVLAVLTSRREWAAALVEAIAVGRISRTDLTADLVRQLRNVADEELAQRMAEVWGVVERTSEEKAKLIAHYRRLIEDRSLPEPDPALGRAVFARVCQQCHKLFGRGGDVGPDLTGSNRADLEYALSNVLDPGAVVAKDYMPSVVVTTDGRVITGIVKQQSDRVLTIQTPDQLMTLPREEVEVFKPTTGSMMPDDLLAQLSSHEVRSLFSYLAAPTQVAMLATPDTMHQFSLTPDFNGWLRSPGIWTFEGSECVGRLTRPGEALLVHQELVFADAILSFEFRCSPEAQPSLLVRAETRPRNLVSGYELFLMPPKLGTVQEREGRGPLVTGSAPLKIDSQSWNHVQAILEGARTRLFVNGHLVVDYHDPAGPTRGLIGFVLAGPERAELRLRSVRVSLPKIRPSPAEVPGR